MSNQQYWVQMDNQSLFEAMKLSREPYQPLYAELIGHLELSSGIGFASDFSVQFVVSSINYITAEATNRCEQPAQATRAFGTEPFWAMDFSKDTARYQEMGQEEQTLPLSSTNLTPTERNYHFNQSELSISRGTCSDTMSDSIFGWSATLDGQGSTKKGCATLSNKDATLSWVDTYIASSTQTNGFTVELTLLPDHSATTSYIYATGLPTKESGYWQQLNNNQVQVVMTQHQGQRLIAERIFTIEGEQITATHEKVNGRLFPIAGGGLTLFIESP
jgi:putative lipoprotein